MSQLAITTTQNVNINFTTANTGDRVLSYLIDLVVFAVYLSSVNFIAKYTGLEQAVQAQDGWTQRAITGVVFLPVALYSLLCENLMEGQSIGKKLLKLKVIKIDGYQAGFSDYLIRWIFRVFESAGIMAVVGIIAMAVNKDSRRLGDLAAGTAVISLRNKINISHTILVELENDYVPTYPDVIKLSDNDMRIIKETYEVSYKTTDFATMERLQQKIEEVTGIKSKNDSATTFVNVVLKDYNYYTQGMLKT